MSAAEATAPAPTPPRQGGMSMRAKLLLGLLGMVALAIILGIAFGSEGENEAFQPQEEYRLDDWVAIHIGSLNLSVNRAVLYLALASIFTIFTMTWIANRMAAKPNRVQTAVELAYDLTRSGITGKNMDARMASRWFGAIATLFFFIWFSNFIGYIPTPTNTHETVDVFGVAVPSFGIYAATANISVPLLLALLVWFSYHYEGIRAKGFVGYLKSWIPAGTPDNPFMKGFIFSIEVISHFVRIISLSVRLFANLLAGHLLILFMGGGLVVLLGLAALGVFTLPLAVAFFLFEFVLIVTLQAFIFATLTAIYLGGATAEHH